MAEAKHESKYEVSTDSVSVNGFDEKGTGMGLNVEKAREYLSQQGWPEGLQDSFIRSVRSIPLRFFIIDNSGSMIINDGNRIGLLGGQKKGFVKCSRWEELQQAVYFHAGLSNAACAATEFRLLNNAEPVVIGESDDGGNSLRNFLVFLKRSRPNESTPLCAHIEEVTKKIQHLENELRRDNQRVAVIICTDGESSDGDIVRAIRPLENLPCNIVVRLCTDETTVIDYWNRVRSSLQADTINILDDLRGAAYTVARTNPWLTYGEPLHRFREFGANFPDLNALDEHPLTPRQLRLLCSHLLGGDSGEYPNPNEDMGAFQTDINRRLNALNNNMLSTWDPIKQAQAKWINVHGLTENYRSIDHKCDMI